MEGRRHWHQVTTDANNTTGSSTTCHPPATPQMASCRTTRQGLLVLMVTAHLCHQQRSYTKNPLKSILFPRPNHGRRRIKVKNWPGGTWDSALRTKDPTTRVVMTMIQTKPPCLVDLAKLLNKPRTLSQRQSPSKANKLKVILPSLSLMMMKMQRIWNSVKENWAILCPVKSKSNRKSTPLRR